MANVVPDHDSFRQETGNRPLNPATRGAFRSNILGTWPAET